MTTHYYQNVSLHNFRKMKSRIVSLENSIIAPFCKVNNFRLDRERYYNETLAMNLYRTSENAKDHIGFFYQDQKESPIFKFYLSKYFDFGNKRYTYSESMDELSLEALEVRLKGLLEQSLVKLESISETDCVKITDLT